MTDFTPRPTTYCGIPMRSRLEARCAEMLDFKGWGWEYEPRAYADPSGQYLPDFQLLTYPEEPPFFVEVKPTVELAEKAKAQMEIIRSSEPEAVLAIVVPGEPCYLSSEPGEWHRGGVLLS